MTSQQELFKTQKILSHHSPKKEQIDENHSEEQPLTTLTTTTPFLILPIYAASPFIT